MVGAITRERGRTREHTSERAGERRENGVPVARGATRRAARACSLTGASPNGRDVRTARACVRAEYVRHSL